MEPHIGIMQGRLVPPLEGRFQCFPRDNWAEEFPRAAAAGLSSIEWIYDAFGQDVNPLTSAEGVAEVKRLSATHGVVVRSLCADYFMDKPFLRAGADDLVNRIDDLRTILKWSMELGIQRIVLPFVDVSKIETPAEENVVIEVVRGALPLAEETGIELHLETSLPPLRFAALLERIPHPLIKVNYDSGNSSSLGYRPQDEFEAYGQRIGSVHVKDRRNGGGTVPLGTGDADFLELFTNLKRIGYRGDYILQVARGESGGEVCWARQNRAWVLAQLSDPQN